MYETGLLASVDVDRLAKAHVCVFEAMNQTTSGRYICFDQVIKAEEDVEKLRRDTGIRVNFVSGNNTPTQFELSNLKLSRLMSRARSCNNTQKQLNYAGSQ